MFKKSKKKKPMNFELNLTSMVDCLSILIIYLLMAAVFSKTDVITTKQALGTESQAKEENSKSLWVEIINDRSVQVSTHGFGSKLMKQTIPVNELNQLASKIKGSNPDVHTALVFPRDSSNCSVLIKTMDLLKKANFRDVGLAPL